MKTLYLDCFAGIAGDMFIGALLNFVKSYDVLTDGIKKIHGLESEEYEIIIEHGIKNGISGINFDVKLNHDIHHNHDHNHEQHHHRHLSDIENMIISSDLSERVKREALRAFSILAEAEANVHGTTPDKIHFHEVGAVDSIIDIIGSLILVDSLGWPRILCSKINVGSGTVKCAHGILPVPAPATEFLLRNLPVFSNGNPMERTTPTGALLVKILADGFSDIPTGKIIASGYGIGNNDSEDMPNVLRALMIDSEIEDSDGLVHEKIAQIECNIDDMNPQDFEIVNEKLFKSGALDVWTESIYMKKNRIGTKLCCLSNPDDTKKLSLIILKNTTSQGVRINEFDRLRLNWKIEKIKTSLGEIDVKFAFIGNELLRKTPEYEDLKLISERNNLAIQEVRRRIIQEI